MKVTHETHVSRELMDQFSGGGEQKKKWKGRVCGERGEETRIEEK